MNPKPEAAGQVDSAGWLNGVERIPSPNHDTRPAGEVPSLLVIHAISLPPGEYGGDAVIELFINRLDPAAHPYFAAIADRRVSAHFFIRRDGRLIQLVSCHERAWHAGVSCWHGRERCNDFTLGVELEGDDFTAYAEAQYAALESLISALRERFPLTAIAGHADIAPGRKTDPGPHFDWPRIAQRQPG
jgi:AmpD protein